jgi:hypothetical protein
LLSVRALQAGRGRGQQLGVAGPSRSFEVRVAGNHDACVRVSPERGKKVGVVPQVAATCWARPDRAVMQADERRDGRALSQIRLEPAKLTFIEITVGLACDCRIEKHDPPRGEIQARLHSDGSADQRTVHCGKRVVIARDHINR